MTAIHDKLFSVGHWWLIVFQKAKFSQCDPNRGLLQTKPHELHAVVFWSNKQHEKYNKNCPRSDEWYFGDFRNFPRGIFTKYILLQLTRLFVLKYNTGQSSPECRHDSSHDLNSNTSVLTSPFNLKRWKPVALIFLASSYHTNVFFFPYLQFVELEKRMG